MSGDVGDEMEGQERTPAVVLKRNGTIIEKSDNLIQPGTSYEVFRNNTTAVEVIVKDVIKKGKKIGSVGPNDIKIVNRLQADVHQMHYELAIANKSLEKARKGFQAIVQEMRKQIDIVNIRESDTQAANLSLKLENEKLKLLLDSKTKLVCRMKKEMAAVKRILKFVVKSIFKAPEIPHGVELVSDMEYEEFENDVKKDIRGKITMDSFDSNTFDTSVSRDNQCFDKKCF